MQSALVVQLVLQALVPQMNGVQELVAGSGRFRCRCRSTPDGKSTSSRSGRCTWDPLAYFWQAPLPSHEPFVPQVATPASVHWLSGS